MAEQLLLTRQLRQLCCSQTSELFHPLKGTLISLHIVTSSCILNLRHDYAVILISIYFWSSLLTVGRVAQSVWRMTTGWRVRERIPVGTRFFAPSRPALGPTQTPVKWTPGLSRGYSAAGACC